MSTNSWSYGQYQQWVLHQRGGINPALYDITAMNPIIPVSQNAPNFFNYVHEMIDNTGKPLFFIGTDISKRGMIFNKNHQLIQTFTFGNNQPGEIAVVPTEDCHVYYMFNQTAPPDVPFGSPYGETIEYLSRIELDGNGDPHVSSTIELRRDWLYSSPGQTNWSSMSERYAISKEKKENGVRFRSVYTYNMTTDQSNFPQIQKTTPEIIEYRVNSGGLMTRNVLTSLEYDIPGSSQLNSGNCFQSEMELSQDGNWLAWSTRQGNMVDVIVINTQNSNNQFVTKKTGTDINGLEFSPGSNRVYLSGEISGNEGVFFWDFQTTPIIQSIPNTQDYSRSEIEFYNDGNNTGFILVKKGLSPQNNTIVKEFSITKPHLNLNHLNVNQWQTQTKYTFASNFDPSEILLPENIDGDLLNAPKLGTSCCRAKIHIDEDADFLNPQIIAGLSNSMLLPGDVTIEGNLTLPTNVIFRNCRIYFRPNASLTVPAGKTLQFKDCSAQACSEAWTGIFVEGGFIINNSNNPNIQYQPVIKDAKVAVTTKGNAVLDFNRAIFDRNILHVELVAFRGVFSPNIKNCEFRGSNVTALNNGNIYIPWPYYGPAIDGIFAHDAGELNLSTNTQNQNVFKGLQNGVRVWKASLTCKEQRFMSCQSGINLQKDYNNPSVFMATIQFNDFIRCQNGIFAHSHQTSIESNVFKNSKIGIYLLELETNATIRLNNKFRNNYYAAVQAINCLGNIEIIGNQVINDPQSTAAGFLISSSYNGKGQTLVQNNQITNVSAGIHVTGYSNPVIHQNNIWLSGAKPSENSAKHVAGIFLLYCKSGNISYNTVEIVNKLDLSIGIGIDNTSNTSISNNTVHDTYHGIYLSSDLITQDFGTQVTCNTIENTHSGITYNWVSNLNGYSFGNYQNPTENRWLSNSFHIEQYNSDGTGCEFHTRATPYAGYDFVPANFNLIGSTQFQSILNSAFTSIPNCFYPNIPINKKLSENPKPGIRMQSKMNLLALLKEQPNLMQNDTALTSFYNQYNQSSYDLLAQVDTLIAAEDWTTARNLNTSIVPDTAMGHAEMKWVNEQWFMYKDGNSVDTLGITDLAAYHVHLKGKAVIKARILKNLLEVSDTSQTVYYEVDGYSRPMAKNGNSTPARLTEVMEKGLYPNPAHDKVFVKGKPLLVECIDMLGKKVMETTETEMTVSGLKKGLYVVVIHYESSIESVKLIID